MWGQEMQMQESAEILMNFPKHIRPLADRVIVFPDREDDTWDKKGLIVKPESRKFKKCQGVVVAVGNGKYFKDQIANMELKVGDKVCYNKYTGVECYFEIAGKKVEFMIMPEREILAKI